MKNQSLTFPAYIDPQWRIGIVASSYYKEEMDALRTSARETLLQAGIPSANILESTAPGSFEVPLIGAALAERKKVDALIGLGIIVEGDTHHAELLAREAAHGIMDVQVKYQLPFAFEILYVDSIEQARQRLSKGEEAALAVLHSLAEISRLHS